MIIWANHLLHQLPNGAAFYRFPIPYDENKDSLVGYVDG